MKRYVIDYFAYHPEIKLIVVAGSVGKTSTKRALGDLLVQRYRVRMHEGNHNSEVSVPLAILGIALPTKLKNPLQNPFILQDWNVYFSRIGDAQIGRAHV